MATTISPLAPAEGETIVRLYRQGLGDSFLIAFGTARGPRYLLIDCGVHRRQTSGSDRLRQVMDDIVGATGGHLHAVIATHQHADHLSGFVQKNSPFVNGKITIDKAWFAWTERRGDTQADRLRARHGTAEAIIDAAVEKLRRARASRPPAVVGVASFSEMPALGVTRRAVGASARASSTEIAMRHLEALADDPDWFEPGDCVRLPDVKHARLHILGPPRDEKLLKKDAPSKVRGRDEYKEVYLRDGVTSAFALSPGLGLSPAVLRPDGPAVPDDLRYPFPQSAGHAFAFKGRQIRIKAPVATRRELADFLRDTYEAEGYRRIDTDWLQGVESLALNLENDTNNTSLALAIELDPAGDGPVLLFAADAQVGNWLSWNRQKYGRRGSRVDIEDLFARTRFYKVGHHGSHNATLRRDSLNPTDEDPHGAPYGLELMDDLIAMIPVDRAAVDKRMPTPWAMPFEPLYERLREKSRRRVLRGDMQKAPLSTRALADVKPPRQSWSPVPGLDNVRWRRASRSFSKGTRGRLYYDLSFGP